VQAYPPGENHYTTKIELSPEEKAKKKKKTRNILIISGCALALVIVIAVAAVMITEDQKKIHSVEDAITLIGEVELGDYDLIEDAREEFDELSDRQQRKVENADALEAAQEKIAALIAEAQGNVSALIGAIGEVTLESEAAIEAAEAAYEALPEPLRGGVENAGVLVSARETFDVLAIDTVRVDGKRYAPQPIPGNGDVTRFLPGKALAPLTVTAPEGGDYYYIVLRTANENAKALALFIHPGQSVETKVPLGDYTMLYASGEKWYGADVMFGPDATYRRMDSVFNFYDDGYFYVGTTIELRVQFGGNLPFEPADSGDLQ
jgi:hypothetical protein